MIVLQIIDQYQMFFHTESLFVTELYEFLQLNSIVMISWMGFSFFTTFAVIYYNLHKNVHYEKSKSWKHMITFFLLALVNLIF